MHRQLEELLPVGLAEAAPVGLAERVEYNDVYREDPYRFEKPGEPLDLQRLAETDDLRRIDYLPTPDEIAGVCAEIRASWTSSEKRRRFVGELPAEAIESAAWAPPLIATTHFRLASAPGSDAV